jgi:hypothetical protein
LDSVGLVLGSVGSVFLSALGYGSKALGSVQPSDQE